MTYAAIKTYIYAGLSKDDPRLDAAVGWARKNYNLDSHPGFEYEKEPRLSRKGLFYYYVMLTKALEALGEVPFKTEDGKLHDWPNEIAEKLLSLQKGETWTNEVPAWWENDPLLVTLYVLTVYDIVLKHLP
jgi:squalene-hopene/tetraprenyl-beta-curcumene cyclase